MSFNLEQIFKYQEGSSIESREGMQENESTYLILMQEINLQKDNPSERWVTQKKCPVLKFEESTDLK